MREIIIRWLEEASKMSYGAKLNLLASNKKEQNLMFEAIGKEINILRKIDPMMASTLVPFKVFKSGRFWVGVERILSIPTLGFIKNPDGKVKKVRLPEIDADRDRRIRLMCEDGLPVETIEELEGPLSPADLEEIKQLKEG